MRKNSSVHPRRGKGVHTDLEVCNSLPGCHVLKQVCVSGSPVRQLQMLTHQRRFQTFFVASEVRSQLCYLICH